MQRPSAAAAGGLRRLWRRAAAELWRTWRRRRRVRRSERVQVRPSHRSLRDFRRLLTLYSDPQRCHGWSRRTWRVRRRPWRSWRLPPRAAARRARERRPSPRRSRRSGRLWWTGWLRRWLRRRSWWTWRPGRVVVSCNSERANSVERHLARALARLPSCTFLAPSCDELDACTSGTCASEREPPLPFGLRAAADSRK